MAGAADRRRGIALYFDPPGPPSPLRTHIVLYAVGRHQGVGALTDEHFVSVRPSTVHLDGQEVQVTYRLVPVDPPASATGSLAVGRPATDLLDSVGTRLAQGPIAFTLVAEHSGPAQSRTAPLPPLGTIRLMSLARRGPQMPSTPYLDFNQSILSERGVWGLGADGRVLRRYQTAQADDQDSSDRL